MPTILKEDLKGIKKAVPSAGYIRAFELYQKPRCRECGRPLRSEESINRGFGHTCGLTIANHFLGRNDTYFGDHAKEVLKHANQKTNEVIAKIRRQEIKVLAEEMFKTMNKEKKNDTKK